MEGINQSGGIVTVRTVTELHFIINRSTLWFCDSIDNIAFLGKKKGVVQEHITQS